MAIINRRAFLKSIAAACGAAVVCPGELLKDEPEWIKWAKYFKSRGINSRQPKISWAHYYMRINYETNPL